MITHQPVKSLLEGDISSRQFLVFYSGVRTVFEKAVEYSQKNLPLHNEVLKMLQLNSDLMQAEYFINGYLV